MFEKAKLESRANRSLRTAAGLLFTTAVASSAYGVHMYKDGQDKLSKLVLCVNENDASAIATKCDKSATSYFDEKQNGLIVVDGGLVSAIGGYILISLAYLRKADGKDINMQALNNEIDSLRFVERQLTINGNPLGEAPEELG